MEVALDTLGCKLNQAETELLARQLVESGCRLVPSADKADVYILNTCTVTHIADGKSRHLLRMAHRRNPGALLVATGCYAERVPNEMAQIEGVSLVVGNDEKPQLPRLLGESIRISSAASVQGTSVTNDYPAFRTRAFIKVQDGCSNFCSYCIVPLVRGKEKSLPVEQVTAEVRRLVSGGYREAVLTGTEIGSYNYDGTRLKDLLKNILASIGVTRLRLTSLQPQEISPELVGLWSDGRLCPHFHLSLQSGSDVVLARMKRRYAAADYRQAVSLIRAMVPGAAITTDVIVGFPGETEEEFEESYNFCRQMKFARIHVFQYSRRKGTEASQMPRQVEARVKKQRSQKMLALAQESAQDFRRQFLGKTMPVLFEQRSNGLWSGYTDNYIKVFVDSSEDLTNRPLPLKLESIWQEGVWGTRR
ncbi:tRNA (N(6)-L-threonylcarbamoyladenosine(37)-C(2))-methylthiotransferase MtaB [Chloroflexota bacterium]